MAIERPTRANGKICYIEIPSANSNESAAFYEKVFGWNIRKRQDGAIAFDDALGEVSGTWVQNREPLTDRSLVLYIMVNDIRIAMDQVVINGGRIVRELGFQAPELTALFSDPAGNVFGLYQEPDT